MIARPGNGLWFVSDVYDGSPAARAGILVGDEIIAIDGAPYHEITSFQGKVGRTVDVELRRRPGAEPVSVKVQVELLKPLPMFEQAITDSAKIVERDGRKIGYIRLWTLAAPGSMSAVAEALATGPLKDADGLVLDLRGRWGGGSSDAAELFVGDTPPFRLIPRGGKEILANVRWHRPLVAIIDEGTRSGLEVFAYALKANGIPLVGTRTAGALLAGTRLCPARRQPARARGFGRRDRRRRAPRRKRRPARCAGPVQPALRRRPGSAARRGDRGNAARPRCAAEDQDLAGLPSLASSPSSNALTASTDFLDAAAGSSALAIHCAACSVAPLTSRAAASGSTSTMTPSSASLVRLPVMEAMQPSWLGQCQGSPSTAGPSRSTMRWISGSSAISI